MNDEIQSVHHPRKNEDLEIHDLNDQFAVYDPGADRIHYLNPTAALVMELCDGTHSPSEIAALVQEAYGLPAPPIEEVNSCLRSFQEQGIVN